MIEKTIPHIKNPLRKRKTIIFRYCTYGIILTIILGMSAHLIVFGTDWKRMSSINEIFQTLFSFLPNLNFIPEIAGPLLETTLMAFLGDTVSCNIVNSSFIPCSDHHDPEHADNFPFRKGIHSTFTIYPTRLFLH